MIWVKVPHLYNHLYDGYHLHPDQKSLGYLAYNNYVGPHTVKYLKTHWLKWYFCENNGKFKCHALILTLEQNSLHFADVIFNYIFLNENLSFFITISLSIVLKGPINLHWLWYWLSIIQIMGPYLNQWWPSVLTNIYITRPQWVHFISAATQYDEEDHINGLVRLHFLQSISNGDTAVLY